MSSTRRLIQQAVKATAAGLDRLRPPPGGLTVLIYHRVGASSGLEVDLPVELFEAQVEALAASGRVTTLAHALDHLDEPVERSAGPIVVTFDDGTADFVDVALPVLVRHGVPSTIYLATRFVDEALVFPGSGTALTWSSVADAAATGLVTVGSHTHSHALLDRLPTDDVADELDRSIDLIEDHLGATPLDFAYPKALLGSAVAEAAVRARFRSAALAGTRANVPGATDRFRLARTPVQVGDGMRWFSHKVNGGMGLEDDLRRLANRRRYARATT